MATQDQAALLHLGALATYHEQAGEALRKVIDGLTTGEKAAPTKASKKAAASAPTISLAKLRDKMTEVIRECGREEAVKLIKAQGADKLADLPEDKFDTLAEEADAALAAAEASKKKTKAAADDDL